MYQEDYTILSSDDPDELQERVNVFLSHGYVCIGGLVCTNHQSLSYTVAHLFLQAVARIVEDEDEDIE